MKKNKNNLFTIYLLLVFILSSCGNNFKKYYPSNTYYDIYIDNSKIENFNLLMVYNITDTVFDEKKIYVVDTLEFKVTNSGVESLNNKYLTERDYDIFTSYSNKSSIEVYGGKDIKIIIKKDLKTIDSYNVNLENSKYQYIINPMAKSKFKYGTVQYGGLVFEELPTNIYSSNFISFEKADFFLTAPPETLSYTYEIIDPCLIGCKRTYLEQIR